MRKNVAAIMLLLWVTNAVFAATGRGLQVRPADDEFFNLKPKEILTTSFRVTNDSDRTHEIIIEADLPKDWHLVTDYFPIFLDSGQSLVQYLSVFVPESTRPGRYNITFLARSRKYLSLSDSYTINVNVEPESEVTIKLIENPKYVTFNQDYQARFKVTNPGNTEQKIALNINSNHSFPVVLDEYMIVLAPGRSRTVTATARILDNVDNILDHDLILSAQLISKDAPKQKITVLCSSQVIPVEIDIPQQPPTPTEEKTMLAKGKSHSKTPIISMRPSNKKHQQMEVETIISQDEDDLGLEESPVVDSQLQMPLLPDVNMQEKALADLSAPQKLPVESQPKKKSSPQTSADVRPASSPRFILSRTTAQEFIETQPRQVITTVFNVSNPSGVQRQFVAELQLPDGWTQIVPLPPFYLNPNQTITKLVNVFVPQTAFAGQYDFTFIIYDIKEPSFRDSITMRVNVLTVSELQIELLEAPDFVISGEGYQVKFLITNKSNKNILLKQASTAQKIYLPNSKRKNLNLNLDSLNLL
ncbi:MAG: COG1470 family protein [Planctomycetota bacterium]|jgi:hypothetical protein